MGRVPIVNNLPREQANNSGTNQRLELGETTQDLRKLPPNKVQAPSFGKSHSPCHLD